MKIPTRNGQPGFSTVELLISMVLGLLVVGAIGGLFVQHKMNYRQNEQFALMQENGRFALNLLASDLAAAGFWGGLDCGATPCAASITLDEDKDCGSNWALNTGTSLEYFLATELATDPKTRFPCVKDENNHWYKPGTNVFSIKHAKGQCIALPGDSNRIYLNNSGGIGTIARGTGTGESICANNTSQLWEHLVHIYYIGISQSVDYCASNPKDGRCIPSLRRKTLSYYGGSFSMNEQNNPPNDDSGGEIIEGIEYFHIEFGIDDSTAPADDLCDNMDGIPDFYVSTADEFAAIAQADHDDLDCAISARIHVLVRSAESDSSYTDNVGATTNNDKVYTFGPGTLLPDSDPVILRFEDQFRRKVFTTTVQLRNQQYH